jgi:hypothetical protein
MGILALEKKYSRPRLNKAYRLAMEFEYYSYKGIKRILDNKMDDYQPEQYTSLPDHANIRGKSYYNN